MWVYEIWDLECGISGAGDYFMISLFYCFVRGSALDLGNTVANYVFVQN